MVLRWGILTAGKICHDFVNAFKSYPELEGQAIAAVAAKDIKKAKEFAKLHNIGRVYGSYKELAESKEVDIIYIGALTNDHYEYAKMCLANGKHVLCEKALTLNLKQTQSLIKFARSKKLFLMEAVWSRFFPSYIQLEKDIQSGKLGEVKMVEANFGIPIQDIERIRNKHLGGGVVLDIGIYVLQLAQYVFKEEPTKVTVCGNLNENGVDITETIILEYKGGKRAVLNANGVLQLKNRATIYGTKGSITLEDPFHCAEYLTYDDGTKIRFPLHSAPHPYNFLNSSGLVYQAVEVKRCIEQGLLESPRMPHNESLLLAKLEDTVRHQLGARFDVDDMEFP